MKRNVQTTVNGNNTKENGNLASLEHCVYYLNRETKVIPRNRKCVHNLIAGNNPKERHKVRRVAQRKDVELRLLLERRWGKSLVMEFADKKKDTPIRGRF